MSRRPHDPRFLAATEGPALAAALAEGLRSALPGAQWETLRATKALPHRSGGFAVQYTVATAAGELAHIGGLLPANPTDRPKWAGTGAGTLWLANCGLAVALPGCDPQLPGVAAVLTPEWTTDLAHRLGWKFEPQAPAQILAYRLGKRCVLRVTNATETAIVKVVRPGRLDTLVTTHLDALAEAAVAVPRILYVDPGADAMVMAEVPGVVLSEVGPDVALAAHKSAGALLRAYHRPAGSHLGTRTADDEISQLVKWTGLAAALFPDLSNGLAKGLAGLGSGPAGTCEVPCRLHRDFYDKQLIVGPDQQLTLLDLDTAAGGDPALDLGNYLAHIRLRHLQMPTAAGPTEAQISNAFLSGYAPDANTRDRLGWWQAAALLRLAVVYSLRPRWRTITGSLLEAVES